MRSAQGLGLALPLNAGVTAAAGGGSGSPLSNQQAVASADTTVSSTVSWTDITGCSFSLGAGTWLVDARLCFGNVGGSTFSFYAKVYNSTDAVDYLSAEEGRPAGYAGDICMPVVFTLTGTKTIKLAGRCNGSSWTVYRYGDTTIPCTMMTAVQLA